MRNTTEKFFFNHIMTGVLSMQGVDLNPYVAEMTRLLDGDLPPVSLFSRYKPRKDWFNPDTEGWHGVAHATRVSVSTELLSRILIRQGMALDVEALRWGLQHTMWEDFMTVLIRITGIDRQDVQEIIWKVCYWIVL